MEKSQKNMERQKLKFFDLLKEAMVIPCKSSNFIIFSFLFSIPMLCFLVLYEIFFQRTLIDALAALRQSSGYFNYSWLKQLHMANLMTEDVSYTNIQMGIFYFLSFHLLELCSMIVIVNLASKVYTEGRPMTLKELVHRISNRARFKGILVTSVHILFLSSVFLVASIWLMISYYVILRKFVYHMYFAAVFRGGCVVLIAKYLEGSALWNMSIVISILDEIHGTEALVLSAYYSRGKERLGLALMFVFFVWEISLRSVWLYTGYGEYWYGIIVLVFLLGLRNVMKWVVFVIYFYNCKRKVTEKKLDEEVGIKVKAVAQY